jgi:release factor glutamine methyltransferase
MIAGRTPLLERIRDILERAGVEEAAADAATIVAAATGDEASIAASAEEMAALRASGVPLAYVIGRTRFMGVDVFIAHGALVPRAETELLGNTASRMLGEVASAAPRLIDMCCGSGNLVCGIAVADPRVRAWASDLTDGAFAVAKANVQQLHLTDRVVVVQGDLFAPLAGLALEGSVDVIVCNPPYISTGKLEKDRATLLEHEPREAFDGGPYGVSIFQRVVRDALPFLKPGGSLLFEIGVGQSRQVTLLFDRSRAYETVAAIADASGEPRVVTARKKPGNAGEP